MIGAGSAAKGPIEYQGRNYATAKRNRIYVLLMRKKLRDFLTRFPYPSPSPLPTLTARTHQHRYEQEGKHEGMMPDVEQRNLRIFLFQHHEHGVQKLDGLGEKVPPERIYNLQTRLEGIAFCDEQFTSFWLVFF